jgi:hypothetical protein
VGLSARALGADRFQTRLGHAGARQPMIFADFTFGVNPGQVNRPVGRTSARDFGLDQQRQQLQRLLPTDVAAFDGNHGGNAFLCDVQLGAA